MRICEESLGEKSVGACRDAIAIGLSPPRAARAYLVLGSRMLFELGRCGEAEVAYREAIQLAPEDTLPRFRLAQAVFCLGRYEDSIQAHREVIRLDRKDHAAHYALGKLLFDQGRYSEALELYRDTARVDPQAPDPFYKQALILSRLNRHEEAVNAFREGLQLNPIDLELDPKPEELKAMGWSPEDLRNWSEAVKAERRRRNR